MVVSDEDGALVAEAGEYIGEATNNVAEYKALVKGLEMCRKEGADVVRAFLDSELIVMQMQGAYKVKNAGLKPLYAAAREMEGEFTKVTYAHVPREDNTEADALVNKALDAVE